MNFVRLNVLSNALKYLYVVLGCTIVMAAAVSMLTNMPLEDLLHWIDRHFGIVFCVLFFALVLLGVYCVAMLHRLDVHVESNKKQQKLIYARRELYSEIGVHCANGVSTLALTFTLLGISLGIGSLSSQSLTPDHIQTIISALTEQFSMAFMTTVVGLPTAALLRAGIGIVQVMSAHNGQCDDKQKSFVNNEQASNSLQSTY